MSYGWAGSTLEIDLSRGKIESEQNAPQLYETYLGGKGIGTKLLWDKVPPEVQPFSPDNLLIFTAGVLTSTPTPTASHGCISFKSPQTNLMSYSILGGFWAPELKYAGYDSIVVSGKSPSPVYLWINNDHIEIRDASHLWGKDTVETRRIIQEELKNDKVQILCIGIGGENKAHMATIEDPGTGTSASRTGGGAVMGDKNLKAVAIYGTRDINVARPAEFMELCKVSHESPDGLRKWLGVTNEGISRAFIKPLAYSGMYGNISERPPGLGFENIGEIHASFVRKSVIRETACYNCSVRCRGVICQPDGGYSYVKCLSWYVPAFACKIPDIQFCMECYYLMAKYGLDVITTSLSIAFAIDLYEKGILTREDTDGMHLEYGNRELALTLIEKIARREGIGAILANGTYEAARTIGKGAEKYVPCTKKMEPETINSRYDPFMAFSTATSDTAGLRSADPSLWSFYWGMERDEYLERNKAPYANEKKYPDAYYEGIAECIRFAENVKIITDSTGLCSFYTGTWSLLIFKPGAVARLISHATGTDIDEAKLMRIAERIRTLTRASIVRLGIRRKDDTVPEKFFRELPPAHQREVGLRQLDHDNFDKQLDRYYKLRGWNSEGIPTKRTLDELELGYVRQDLEQRGIL